MREPLACLSGGTVLVSLSDLFESPRNAHVKRIWPVDICGTITPMLVHPEPRGRVFSHVRLERIPACLRNLSMCHFGRLFDLWVEDHPSGSGSQCAGMIGAPVSSCSQACAEVTLVCSPKQSITTPCLGRTVRSTSSAVRPFRRSVL
jgi:hypothetical protein